VLAFGAAALVTMVTTVPVGAASGIKLAARIDGTPVDQSSETRPVALHPTRRADVAIEVTNRSDSAVVIRTVRVGGSVLGLSFFAYETAVRFTVEPGQTLTTAFQLDLGDLKGQATGLIVGSVSLLDDKRAEVATEALVVDVRGSMRSVYGVFGIGVATATALSVVALFVALARQKLHRNRWRRAVRFFTPGVGLGLSIVFTLSAMRIFVPRPGRWLPIVATCSIVAFLAGYFTPASDSPDDDEDEDDEDGEDDEGDEDHEAGRPAASPTRGAERRS